MLNLNDWTESHQHSKSEHVEIESKCYDPLWPFLFTAPCLIGLFILSAHMAHNGDTSFLYDNPAVLIEPNGYYTLQRKCCCVVNCHKIWSLGMYLIHIYTVYIFLITNVYIQNTHTHPAVLHHSCHPSSEKSSLITHSADPKQNKMVPTSSF